MCREKDVPAMRKGVICCQAVLINLPAASCRVSKDFLPVTARSVATRQSHCKRLLRFARALKGDVVILRKCPWGAMTFFMMIRP
jgi:hypothetical protein